MREGTGKEPGLGKCPIYRGDNWDIWRDVIMPVKDRGGPPRVIPPGLRLALSMGRCVDMETRPGSGRR